MKTASMLSFFTKWFRPANAASVRLNQWVHPGLFDTIPMAASVIDQDYNLVYANPSFESMFGPWDNRKCFNVYKNRTSVCPRCNCIATFADGIPRVTDDTGYNRSGKPIKYRQRTAPITGDNGKVSFLLQMLTDITEYEQFRDDYQSLFDRVPCSILLIDREFHIVKTNRTFRKTVGEVEGKFCYESLKGLDHKCAECTARQTFEDGMLRSEFVRDQRRGGGAAEPQAPFHGSRCRREQGLFRLRGTPGTLSECLRD